MMMGSSDSTNDKIKYRIEMLRILYARGYSLILMNPAVPNFADYFDSNQYFTLEELIRFVEQGYGIVLCKHKDGRILIGIDDIDIQDKNILRAIESALGNTLVQRKRRGYHLLFFLLFFYSYSYYVNGSDNVTQGWYTITTGILGNLTQVSVRTRLICYII
jgi:hypothetical protein